MEEPTPAIHNGNSITKDSLVPLRKRERDTQEPPTSPTKKACLSFESLPSSWAHALKEANLPLPSDNLLQWVNGERSHSTIYPEPEDVFAAFHCCDVVASPSRVATPVKVVILGQDPYFGSFRASSSSSSLPQAHGLSFSVRKGCSPPPSLVNIFEELKRDLGDDFTIPSHGDLSSWAQQGVLLLNTVLTVKEGHPRSHASRGWEEFTDGVIKLISQRSQGVVFLLWGKDAKAKADLIDIKKHYILRSSHPSPKSADFGFKGCSHFSRTNRWLMSKGLTPINWDSLTHPLKVVVMAPSPPLPIRNNNQTISGGGGGRNGPARQAEVASNAASSSALRSFCVKRK